MGDAAENTTAPRCDVCGATTAMECQRKNALGQCSGIESPLVEVGRTRRGYVVYRQANGAGGHTYWCDDIGGGRVVWDTCLDDHETLAIALTAEGDRAAQEAASVR